jgi:hypothetical protein
MWSEFKSHREFSPVSAFLLKLASVQKQYKLQLYQLEVFHSLKGLMKILHSFISYTEDNKALVTDYYN